MKQFSMFATPGSRQRWLSSVSLGLMRRLLFACLIAATPCAADTPQRYTGIVRREGTGAPVSGVRIIANLDPKAFLFFGAPFQSYVEVGATVTRVDGRFELTVNAPQKRLWFQARTIPKIIPEGPHDTRIILQDVVLRQPRPETLNVIEVPPTFRPQPKNWRLHDHVPKT